MFDLDQEGTGLADETMKHLITAIQEELNFYFPAGTKGKGIICNSLNLSRNKIGDSGIKQLVRFLIQADISVIRLKLFKNQLGDIGAKEICKLLIHSTEPMQELHLSHNEISWFGAWKLLTALSECGRYPFSKGENTLPLWLRVENNFIDWHLVMTKSPTKDIPCTVAESLAAAARLRNSPVVMHSRWTDQAPEPSQSSAKEVYPGVKEKDAPKQQVPLPPSAKCKIDAAPKPSWKEEMTTMPERKNPREPNVSLPTEKVTKADSQAELVYPASYMLLVQNLMEATEVPVGGLRTQRLPDDHPFNRPGKDKISQVSKEKQARRARPRKDPEKIAEEGKNDPSQTVPESSKKNRSHALPKEPEPEMEEPEMVLEVEKRSNFNKIPQRAKHEDAGFTLNVKAPAFVTEAMPYLLGHGRSTRVLQSSDLASCATTVDDHSSEEDAFLPATSHIFVPDRLLLPR